MPDTHQLSSAEHPFELSAPGRIDVHASARQKARLDLDEETEMMLEYAQSLLGHQVPAGDLPKLLRKLLEIAIPQLEKQKIGVGSRPARSGSNNPRHLPVHVKCTVWKRDRGQCTFVSESGKRCLARSPIEFDHILEMARGGASTVENIRLRCRAHNQYTAEKTFGAGFLQLKRASARRASEKKRATPAAASSIHADGSDDRDVTPWLRALGHGVEQVRRAVAQCGDLPNEAPAEERVKAVLRYLLQPHRHVTHVAAGG
jgi:hypothetical protein